MGPRPGGQGPGVAASRRADLDKRLAAGSDARTAPPPWRIGPDPDRMPVSSTSSRRPLDGVRIVDMSSVLMGPYATQILGDYGADVVKVEPPSGDVMRLAGPMRSRGMGSLFLAVNRNKRSLVLDVKKPAGRAVLVRLCQIADVFVHNVRAAAMRRLDLGEDALRAHNPRLVYVSLVGYGERGPYAGRPAYDDLIQGATGIASLFADSGEPRYVPLTMADRIVGLNAVHAILAALIERDRAGEGQSIELPMFETMAQFVLSDHIGGRAFEPPLGPPGYSRLLAHDRRPYRTSDGYVCVLVYNDKQWQSLFQAIGRTEEFRADPRLSDHATRARHYPYVYRVLAEILKTRSTAAWLELLQANDIPCTPLNDLDALIDDPHLDAVGCFTRIDHPSEGTITLTTPVGRWSRNGPGVDRLPPRLGEHSVEVLREAGFDHDEIDRLIAGDVVVDGQSTSVSPQLPGGADKPAL
jgi:crotonobetainyl-CoA:carnitine CoA-transferase CaiB-like acyl-CoA transferase